MWDIKLKATNKQTNNKTKNNSQTQAVVWQLREGVWKDRVVKGKGGQIYGDRKRWDFGWWAHNAIYR